MVYISQAGVKCVETAKCIQLIFCTKVSFHLSYNVLYGN